MSSNTTHGKLIDLEYEWEAYDRLPPRLRYFLREVCPLDVSAEDAAECLANHWNDVEETMRFIRRSLASTDGVRDFRPIVPRRVLATGPQSHHRH